MKIQFKTTKKPIDEVNIGDCVLSYSFSSNKNVARKITDKFTPTIKKEHQISLSTDTETIKCSNIHRMWINDEEWVEAENILIGDFLKKSNGSKAQIIKKELSGYEDATHYDLCVDDTHNYYIGNSSYLSHNSATIHFPFWHKEIEDIITLKNNAKTGDNSVRFLDYSIGFSKLFFDRFLQTMKDKQTNPEATGTITLFSPHEVPDLYDAWGNNELFDKLYVQYENDPNIKSKATVSVEDLMKLFTKERRETARIYAHFMDHINDHSAFQEQITMSNLCVTGDQRAVSNKGLLTVKELYDSGEPLTLFDNVSEITSTPMTLIEKDANVFKVTLENGLTHTVTDYHKILTLRARDNKQLIACKDLKIGDKVCVQTNKGIFGTKDMRDEAFLLGLYQSDGTQHKDRIALDVWEADFDLLDEIQESFNRIHYKYNCDLIPVINQYGSVGDRIIAPAKFSDCMVSNSKVKKKRLISRTLKKALNFSKGSVPQWIWESNEETQWEYLRGLLYADGTAQIGKSKGNPVYISYTDINKEFLEELQLLYLNLGIKATIYKATDGGYHKFHADQKEYLCKPAWRLVVGNKPSALLLEKYTSFLSRKGVILENKKYRNNTKKAYKITSIEPVGKQDVYCVTVNSEDHLWICNGIITSNCQEITQPTKPLQHIDDDDAEIGICILSAINVLEIQSDAELRKVCDIIVRLLDSLIDHQTYPVKAAENFTKRRRSLGVGITNLAALLAKNNLKYDELTSDAPNFVDELMEKIQYNLLLASCNLAKEFGACEKYHLTNYAKGIFPIDTYCKAVDRVVSREPSQNWEYLRERVAKYGLRNSTLTSMMPCESSSVTSNSTNGIEPIKKFFIIKSSKSGKLPFIVPSYQHWKNKYTLQFDMKTNRGYSNITAAIQKWTDMAISCMHYYNYEHFENNKMEDTHLVNEFIYHYKMGNKTLYYTYSNDLDKQSVTDVAVEILPTETETVRPDMGGCESGACSL